MRRDITERAEHDSSREGSEGADGAPGAGFEFDQPLVGGASDGDDPDGSVGDGAVQTDGTGRDRTGGRPGRGRVRPNERPADGRVGFRPLDPFEGPVDDGSRSAGEDAYEEDLGAVVGDLASVLDRATGAVAAVARGLVRGELAVVGTGGGDERTARRAARAAVAEVAALLVLRRRLADVEGAVAGLGGGDAVADPPADVRATLRAASVPAGGASRPDPRARLDALAAEVGEAADEANLLAFNAAVDAAEGGDRADACARLADEVQSLAERSRTEVTGAATLTAPVRAAGGDGSAAGGSAGAGDAPAAADGSQAGDARNAEGAEGPDAAG